MAGNSGSRSTLWNAFLGGIVAVIATAAGGLLIIFVNFLSDATLNKATDLLLSRLDIVTVQGTAETNLTFSAKCDVGQKLIGGFCSITSGHGALQNAGIVGEKYVCTYSDSASPTGVQASATAACLRRR